MKETYDLSTDNQGYFINKCAIGGLMLTYTFKNLVKFTSKADLWENVIIHHGVFQHKVITIVYIII